MGEDSNKETTGKETLGFQTEVRQLLHLMIHSLYSNKEIFLRELISNASDAADKLRFEALADAALLEDAPELAVRVSCDPGTQTITVTDNGIGMSRDELVENLGTIARSGTAEFLGQMTGDASKDAQLLGQFGVGFYSAFIVADKVIVETRRAGMGADEAVRWESDGQGEFSVEMLTREARGTSVTLHLKKEDAEFSEPLRLENLIRKYSDHIGFPRAAGTTGRGAEDGQFGDRVVDSTASRGQGRRIQGVLQTPVARLRRPAELEPQPGRRPARVHQFAVHSVPRAFLTCGTARHLVD